jgi:hypothetical protein
MEVGTMIFRTAYLAVAPDGDPTRHHAAIRTDKFELHVAVVAQGQIRQAVDVCHELIRDCGVVAIALCPGFDHEEVGQISKELGGQVALDVARGDMRSAQVVLDLVRADASVDG